MFLSDILLLQKTRGTRYFWNRSGIQIVVRGAADPASFQFPGVIIITMISSEETSSWWNSTWLCFYYCQTLQFCSGEFLSMFTAVAIFTVTVLYESVSSIFSFCTWRCMGLFSMGLILFGWVICVRVWSHLVDVAWINSVHLLEFLKL